MTQEYNASHTGKALRMQVAKKEDPVIYKFAESDPLPPPMGKTDLSAALAFSGLLGKAEEK